MIFHNLVGLYWAVLGDQRERSERMRQHTLDLIPTERTELERARDRDPRPYLRERASAMLQIADGRSARQVARHGLYKPRKPETVCRWLAAYRAHGLAGLQQRPRGHRGFSPSRRTGTRRDPASATGGLRARAAPLASD